LSVLYNRLDYFYHSPVKKVEHYSSLLGAKMKNRLTG